MTEILKSKITELQAQITDLMPEVYNQDDNAITLVKAYQARISAIMMTINELEGMGQTNMSNLINK